MSIDGTLRAKGVTLLVLITSLITACQPAAASYKKLPVLPTISPRMKALYAEGIAAGNNPGVFSKLGDCMTDNAHFLKPLAEGKAELGEYTVLKPVVERYSAAPARTSKGWAQNSFATPSLAAAGGYNVAGPLDATWADPAWCPTNESPLACEYREARPAVAFIMFGTNDVASTDDKTFSLYMRQIVQQTLDRKIVPVLHTFPTRPENPKRSDELNQLVANIAAEFDVPLINLNRALEALPNTGVDPKDSTHLSLPASGRADVFTPEGLQAGANMRNLLTLQFLEALTR
jgi:hypothetical protein